MHIPLLSDQRHRELHPGSPPAPHSSAKVARESQPTMPGFGTLTNSFWLLEYCFQRRLTQLFPFEICFIALHGIICRLKFEPRQAPECTELGLNGAQVLPNDGIPFMLVCDQTPFIAEAAEPNSCAAQSLSNDGPAG